MSPREARKKWADLSPPLKTISALAGLAPVVGGVWVFASGFLALPGRVDALERHQSAQEARQNHATLAVDSVKAQVREQGRALDFLTCAEIARQQRRDDPTCLAGYFRPEDR